MILDKQNTLGSAQAITVSAASTDYIDQGAAREVGQLDDLQLCFTVTEDFAAVGAATLTLQLQCDDNSGFASPKIAVQSDALAKTSLVAGYRFFMPIPVGLDEECIRAYYSVATGPFTAGKISAHLVQGVDKNRAYADALTPASGE